MRTRTVRRRLPAMLVAALAAIAQVAVAQSPALPRDTTYWIVLAGGQRIPALGRLESRPPVAWFRALNGVLLSVPLDLLDLEATRAANHWPSPLAARNVEIATPVLAAARPPTAARRVGLVGEAAKRAGKSGTFTDLTKSTLAAPAPPAVKPPGRAGDAGR